MSGDKWGDYVAYLRETFVNGMVSRGYRLSSYSPNDPDVPTRLDGTDVAVILTPGFPYLPPDVYLTAAEAPVSWHQESDGRLCLYSTQDRESQPWLDVEGFLARIEAWLDSNTAGWPDDPPATDLEAYIDLPVDPRTVFYSKLEWMDGYLLLKPADGGNLRVSGEGKLAKKSKRGTVSGYTVDIGEVTVPLRSWDDVAQRLADPILGAIDRGRIEVLLVRYTRRSERGTVCITFKREASKRVPQLAVAASEDADTLVLRAGTAASALADKHVYVIGGGALGSHICDGLVRAGVGRLTVRDSDILLPGNVVRHLIAFPAAYGVNKAGALKAVLSSRPYCRSVITSVEVALRDPAEVPGILRDAALVIDATADGAVTAMLADFARISGKTVLTACLQNEGRTQRIDVVPPLNGATALPATTKLPNSEPEVFEAGCGEPISRTPPHAVAEAAAMTVRHAVGHLIGQPPDPAGEVREG